MPGFTVERDHITATIVQRHSVRGVALWCIEGPTRARNHTSVEAVTKGLPQKVDIMRIGRQNVIDKNKRYFN